MDFNTGRGAGGSSWGSNDPSRPLFSGQGPSRGPSNRPSGGTGGEFNLSDPMQSFFSSFVRVITQPAAFYRGIARGGDFVSPLVFGAICCVLAALLSGFFTFLSALVSGTQGVLGAVVEAMFDVVLVAVLGVGGMFLVAGIVHLLVRAYVKPNAGFEATFRVIAYSYVTQVLGGWIPVINLLVGLYALYLGIVGVREVHSTTTGRAVRSFAVIIALYVLIVVGVILAILLPIALGT